MSTRVAGLVAALLMAAAGAAMAQAQAPAGKDQVPIMAVAGCVDEPSPGTWRLTQATDPVPSIANAPPASQPYTGPTSGKNTFSLIGVSEFNLPAHKGHTVLVKGLYIKADPMSRLNVTSVTMLKPTC